MINRSTSGPKQAAGRRIGIYPGTFDPVHPGHIAFAREAMRACRLDEVIFLPEPSPRGKTGVASLARRMALLDRALPAPGLRVAQVSSQRFSVSETLPELLALFGEARLTLLLGSDVARGLPGWQDLGLLLASASLTIGLRGDDTAEEMQTIIQDLQASHGRPITCHVLRAAHSHLASSQLRTSQKNQ